MALEQSQHHCNRCGNPTLHQRTTSGPPNLGCLLILLTFIVLSFLLPIISWIITVPVILATVGVWFVWALVAAVSQPPFRCTQCGQAAGEIPSEQKAAIARERELERESEEARMAPLRAERARARAAMTRRAWANFIAAVQSASSRLARFAEAAVRHTNRLLLKMVGGEENIILYHFLQVATVAILLVSIVTTGVLLCEHWQTVSDRHLAAVQAAERQRTEEEAARKKTVEEAARAKEAEAATERARKEAEAAREKARKEAARKNFEASLLSGVDLGGGVKITFVLIPAGSFMMGSNEDGSSHKVTISRPFFLGKYEVTQEQWQAIMEDNPSGHKGPQKPVENVSWDQCQTFLDRLNARFGTDTGKFQLPTEAQWEYACRAGSTTKYCFGDDESQLGDYAWYDANSDGTTHPVGQKKPNAWGLYDMHGNVREWCADWYGESYYRQSPVDDPSGPATAWFRVVRGGYCKSPAGDCRAACRDDISPSSWVHYTSLGFRVSRSLVK
jgi:formylglycine-generating enzyme required for sulfatase activity